jgi:hypothetical protein
MVARHNSLPRLKVAQAERVTSGSPSLRLFGLENSNVVIPPYNAENEAVRGCFVSVWPKADYLLAISILFPVFVGAWAT